MIIVTIIISDNNDNTNNYYNDNNNDNILFIYIIAFIRTFTFTIIITILRTMIYNSIDKKKKNKQTMIQLITVRKELFLLPYQSIFIIIIIVLCYLLSSVIFLCFFIYHFRIFIVLFSLLLCFSLFRF